MSNRRRPTAARRPSKSHRTAQPIVRSRTRTRRRRALPSQPTLYQLRIDVDDAIPPIWRRVDVDAGLTLEELHAVIQAAFGWSDSHLHLFTTAKNDPVAETFVSEFSNGDTAESSISLGQLIGEPGDRLFYWYDFGDDWWHTLKLESTRVREPDEPRATLVEAYRASPPDDCGGIRGYQNLVEMMRDPAGADDPEVLDWFEGLVGDLSAFDAARADVERHRGAVARSLG